MHVKVASKDLKSGMFVADLDRPWIDTPFLLQGFLIEEGEQIQQLQRFCRHVMVDLERSTGDEYRAPEPFAPVRRAAASRESQLSLVEGSPPLCRSSLATGSRGGQAR